MLPTACLRRAPCPKCNRPLTWLRLRQGFVCECGADFTKAVTGNASPVQLLTTQFVAGARDHALISPPKAPISGFEYSSGELYDVLTWAEAVRGACRRPTPLVYLHYSADSVSSKTQALHASDLAAVRLLSSLPDSIHDKARRLRCWVCRYKQGPLVLWARDPIFGKLMSDGEFRRLAMEHLLHKVYGALKGSGGPDQSRI